MDGMMIALLGAVMAVFLGAIGSIIGVTITSLAASGLMSREPDKFGATMLLIALPGTHGIYGFLGGFLIINKLNLLNAAERITSLDPGTGWLLFAACLPVALCALIGGIYQGQVCVAGVNIIAKQGSARVGFGILYAAMVETYAVLGLIATFLLIQGINIPTAAKTGMALLNLPA